MIIGSDHHSLVALTSSLWACGSAVLRTLSVGIVIRSTECGFGLQASGLEAVSHNQRCLIYTYIIQSITSGTLISQPSKLQSHLFLSPQSQSALQAHPCQ